MGENVSLVTWINRGTVPHALTSGEADFVVLSNIFNTGVIPAGNSCTVTIRSAIMNLRSGMEQNPSGISARIEIYFP
jgi:hypothetical protein